MLEIRTEWSGRHKNLKEFQSNSNTLITLRLSLNFVFLKIMLVSAERDREGVTKGVAAVARWNFEAVIYK